MLVVQKYGGSSVGSPEKIRKVADRIAQRSQQGDQVVVVVSAMGDTTDELIDLARRVTSHPHERELDMLLTAGERISMALLTMALRDLNCDAISFTGSQAGIITDQSHTRACILEIKPIRVKEELNRGRVVIVAGFQGVSRTKEITTLGRGGSDTTAVAMAAALEADRCEILTDVAGIYSADPRLVPQARRYEELPLDLIFEMAVRGAQVMHPRSIEIAREKKFPIYVGLAHPPTPNRDLKQEGTMLVPETGLELPKVVGVTARKNLKMLCFEAVEAATALAELAKGAFLAHHLAAESDGGLCLLLDPFESESFLQKFPKAVRPESYSAVSVVGHQLQYNSAVPAKIWEVLETLQIRGAGLTSHTQSITVWFPEPETAGRSDEVVKQLHSAFI